MRVVLKKPAIMIASIGCMIGLLLFSLSLLYEPFDSNDILAGMPYADADGLDLGEMSEEYGRRRNQVLSSRYPLQDSGMAFATIGIFLGWAISLMKVQSFDDLRRHQVPERKGSFFLLFNGSLVALAFGSFIHLVIDQNRGEFPPWEDSLAIPMLSLMAALPVLAIFGNILLLPLFLTKKQTVLLFVWDDTRRVRSTALLILTLPFVFVGAAGIAASLISGDYLLIPPGVILSIIFRHQPITISGPTLLLFFTSIAILTALYDIASRCPRCERDPLRIRIEKNHWFGSQSWRLGPGGTCRNCGAVLNKRGRRFFF